MLKSQRANYLSSLDGHSFLGWFILFCRVTGVSRSHAGRPGL